MFLNGSKILTKDISCECECRFNGEKNVIQINGGMSMWVWKTSCMWKRI